MSSTRLGLEVSDVLKLVAQAAILLGILYVGNSLFSTPEEPEAKLQDCQTYAQGTFCR